MCALKWIRSVDNYGRRQPSLVVTVIASSKPRRNLAYKFLSMSWCVRPKTIESVNKYGRTAAIANYHPCCNNLVIASLPRLLVGFFRNLSEMFHWWSSCVRSKRFLSVDKYGRRQPSLIVTVFASPPKPPEEFSRNLAYEFLWMSRYIRRKMILVRQQMWPKGGHL